MKTWFLKKIIKYRNIPLFLFSLLLTDKASGKEESLYLSNNDLHTDYLWSVDENPEAHSPKVWDPSADRSTSKSEKIKDKGETIRYNDRSAILFPLESPHSKPIVKKQLKSTLTEPPVHITDSTVDHDFNLNLDVEAELLKESTQTDTEGGKTGIVTPIPVHGTASTDNSAKIGRTTQPVVDTAQTSRADFQPDTANIFKNSSAEEEAKLYRRLIDEQLYPEGVKGASASETPTSQTSDKVKSVIAGGNFYSHEGLVSQEILDNNKINSENKVNILGDQNTSNVMRNSESSNPENQKKILVNFTDVSILEYLKFISRYTNKNFIFDQEDLQFNVTIISEEQTTIENVLTALIQELRIHGLVLIEQGNNLIIHKNPGVNSISKVVSDAFPDDLPGETQLVTRVFQLNTLDADKAAEIIKPLVSESSIVDALKATNHLIITDLSSNVAKIAKLIKSLDSPVSGMVVGQYVVKNAYIDTLVELAQKIMEPLAQEQSVILVPHSAANSIFIVSSPYLVERTISVLQRLDQTQGTTGVYNMEELQLRDADTKVKPIGKWEVDKNGNWRFTQPGESIEDKGGKEKQEISKKPPVGAWGIGRDGNWEFTPGKTPTEAGPKGDWMLDPKNQWMFQLQPGASITPEVVKRVREQSKELPIGHIEKTKFYIHKLQFRSGQNIADALQRIADSLSQSSQVNPDLLQTISSVQWIETSNSLVFTGDETALRKVRELVEELDTPLRQVFIEMLILNTTINDSLQYGVNFISRFNNINADGAQAFLDGGNQLGSLFPGSTTVASTPAFTGPGLIKDTGYTLGIIGKTITKGGVEFASIAALIRALHSEQILQVVLNPKIITEDNQPAEIFVGVNTPFQSQAITNDFGTVITQNVEFRDVGTRLRVTPLLGNSDIITLIIEIDLSAIQSSGGTSGTTAPGTLQTTTKSTTTTRVHMPDGYFLVISGLMNSRDQRDNNYVPCLGGAPILGALFKSQRDQQDKTNIMTFIRPKIIDTEAEIQNLTRHQQDIFRIKSKVPESWKLETQKALEFLNISDICNPDCKNCDYNFESDWYQQSQ